MANELKLGGRKNPDQILKYAYMIRHLRDENFIADDDRFVLLFVSDKPETLEWEAWLHEELAYCQTSTKSTSKMISEDVCQEIARNAEYAATTWRDLVSFNERYLEGLDSVAQQVEIKLLKGFNHSLSQKNFMRQN